MNALAASTVKDADAIAAVKSLDYGKQLRMEIWRERYGNSGSLNREFASAEAYSAYMEAVYEGRARIFGT